MNPKKIIPSTTVGSNRITTIYLLGARKKTRNKVMV